MVKFKQAFLILLIVFLGAASAQFLINLLDEYVFESMLSFRWSTNMILWDSVVVAVLAYFFAWLIPLNRTFGVGSGPVHVVDNENREKHT
jgi:H+/Cl- antiporter ClcA